MQPCIWVMLCFFNQNHTPSAASASREGNSRESNTRRSIHVALCSIRNDSTLKSPSFSKHKGLKSWSKPLNPSSNHAKAQCSLAETDIQRIFAEQQQRSAWFHIAFALCLSSPAPFHEHNVFCSLQARTDVVLVHLFSPLYLCQLCGIYSHCPPSILPLFRFCSVAQALYQSSFFQSVRMSDIALSGFAYPPPLPHSSSLLSSSLLSQRRREDSLFLLLSLHAFHVHCMWEWQNCI